MKDYYSILGVSPTAHASDIKRAYRRLVQQFHPDINPDPQAAELIKAVNEAYDVLGDPVKRSAYDYSLRNPFTTIVVDEAPPHRDRAYRRRGPYKPPPPKGPSHSEMIVWVMPYLINIARVGLGVCLILLIDIMLPAKRIEDAIRHFYVSDTGRGNATIMVSESGRELKLRREDFVGTQAGDPIIFVETKLLKELLRVEGAEGGIILNDFASLYDNFLFLPLIVGFCSLMIVFKIGAAELRFNMGVVNTFVLIFTIILMF